METTEIDLGTAKRPPHRKVLETYRLASPLRECSTELSLLADDYLKVHVVRPRTEPRKFVIDLRYLNSQPVRVRHIAWPWFALGGLFLLATGVALWWAATLSGSFFANSAFAIACIAATATAATTFLGVRFTTDSLNFTSVNGGATCITVVGGLGSTESGEEFFVKIINGIASAKEARPQAKQQLLRDEMREHHRLRELGAITEADYEASKVRILKAHA